MAATPPQSDWPTQVEDRRTSVIEGETTAGAPVPPPADPRRRVLHELWPWLLALVVLVVAGLVALWWFQHRDQHPQRSRAATATQPALSTATLATPARVPAPKVLGLTQAEATARLERAGLQVQARAVKGLAAPGTVVAQKPAPGQEVERDSTVLLDVVRGKPALAVPDVTGKPAPAAIADLRKAGFLTAVVGVPSPRPKGTVVAEAPAPGATATPGTKIRLNISRGAARPAGTVPAPTASTPTGTTPAETTTPARTSPTGTTTPAPQPTSSTVPSVAPLAQTPALRALEQAGLHAQVTLVTSSEPAGRVIAQQPSAHARASRGEVVQLNVSLGPNAPAQQATVPDVSGQDVQQATQTLQDAGFAVETVDRKITSAAQDGKVVDAQPSGQAPPGWTITLVVGRVG
jgi:serine/threonine-protein kinase